MCMACLLGPTRFQDSDARRYHVGNRVECYPTRALQRRAAVSV